MADITRAPAGIKPPTTLGTNSVPGSEYAALDGYEIKGHPIQVETIAELHAWPLSRRQWGQLAYVVNDPLKAGYNAAHPSPAEFRLDDWNGDNDLSNNTNWVALSTGGDQQSTTLTAGVDLLPERAIRLDNGSAVYAQPTDLTNARVYGVTTTSALSGGTVTVQTHGLLNVANAFTGPQFWLGTNGLLQGSPPVAPAIAYPLGRVISGGQLFFEPSTPTELL